ncbi:MAG TPA: MIP/aquaporin family protein [Candidatus Limnocylindrales bacterium]
MTEKFLAEVFGTAVLILLGDGVVAAVLLAKSKAQNAGWIVITMAWGLAVFCGVVIAGPLSGAHLNPAVTLGLAVMEAMKQGSTGVTWAAVPPYLAGEMIGAMIGASLVALHYWDHFKATEDQGLKLAVFSTGPAIRNLPLNLISEIIGTFVLVFVIFAFGQNHSLAPATMGALPVALLVVVIGLSLGGTTGYAINPARDLGPRIVHAILPIPGKGGSDWGYSWVPVVGPLIGGAIAAVVFYAAFTNFIVLQIPK